MITESLVSEKLQSFDYYKNKLPQYLQTSFGFIEHFRIWHTILKNDVIDNADILLNMLRIFDSDYFAYLHNIDETITANGTTCDIIDKIGNLFGVTRKFRVSYESAGTTVTRDLTLTNAEFLILIKAQIIKNYCEGTREQIAAYYTDAGLGIFTMTNTSSVANAVEYLTDSVGSTSYQYSQNVKDMFLAGMLRIASVGVKYTCSLLEMDRILTWDIINQQQTNGWDGGIWIV